MKGGPCVHVASLGHCAHPRTLAAAMRGPKNARAHAQGAGPSAQRSTHALTHMSLCTTWRARAGRSSKCQPRPHPKAHTTCALCAPPLSPLAKAKGMPAFLQPQPPACVHACARAAHLQAALEAWAAEAAIADGLEERALQQLPRLRPRLRVVLDAQLDELPQLLVLHRLQARGRGTLVCSKGRRREG